VSYPLSIRGRVASISTRWLVVLPVALMVVSDFELRQRGVDDSLGGRPDAAVLFEVAVYGLAGLVLIAAYVRDPARARVAAPILALWGYGVTMTVSAVVAPFPVMATVRGAQLLVMCLLGTVLSMHAGRKEVMDTIHVYLGVVAAAVAFGVVVPFPPVTRLTAGRFTWMYVHPVVSGAYLAIAFVIALALALRRKRTRWPRASYSALAVVFAVALLQNESRGSLAAAAVGGIVVAVSASSRRARPGRVLAIAGGASLLVLAAGPKMMQYVLRGESTEKLSTLNSRTELWSEAWRLFSQRPLSGWGLGSTRGLFLESIGLGGAHNAFVNVIVDGGIAGMFWWVAVIGCVLVSFRRLARVASWREEVPLMAGIMAALLVNAITIEGLGAAANVSSVWLVVLVGWCVAGRRAASTLFAPSLGRPVHATVGRPRVSAP
jgi:hypothetical protein